MKIYEDHNNSRCLDAGNEIWGNFQSRILEAPVPVRKVISNSYVEYKIYEGMFALFYGFISFMLEYKALMPLTSFESVSKWNNPADLRFIAERDTGLVDQLEWDLPLYTGVRLLETPGHLIPYSAVGRKFVLDGSGKLMILDIIHDSFFYLDFWTHVTKYQSQSSTQLDEKVSELKDDDLRKVFWVRLLCQVKELETIRADYPDFRRIVVIRPSHLNALSRIMGYSCDHLPDHQNEQGQNIPLKEHAGLYKHPVTNPWESPEAYPDDISFCSDEEFLKLAKLYDPTLNSPNCEVYLFEEFGKLFFVLDDLRRWRSIRDAFIDKLASELLDYGNTVAFDKAEEYLKSAQELLAKHPNDSITNSTKALEMVLKGISYKTPNEDIKLYELIKDNSQHETFKKNVVEAHYIREKRNQVLHTTYDASFNEAEDIYYKTAEIFKQLTQRKI